MRCHWLLKNKTPNFVQKNGVQAPFKPCPCENSRDGASLGTSKTSATQRRPSYATCKYRGVLLFHDLRGNHGLDGVDITGRIQGNLYINLYFAARVQLRPSFSFIYPS